MDEIGCDVMEMNKSTWLPHLTSEVVFDARGPELCAYAVALEGWRRGLTLRWHAEYSEKFKRLKTWNVDSPGKLFSLSSNDKTHYFFRTRGDKVTNEAVEIGGDKELTKIILSKHGIPVPEGKRFKENIRDDEIVRYVSDIGYPVVIKPTDGSFGRGVVTNIRDEDSLVNALNYVRQRLNMKDILIERHIPGKEYRLYVVGDQVVGALHRVPANVVGDGVHSIRQLIDMKNEERKKNPRLCSCLIVVDQELINYLQASDKKLESIPKKGERIFLRDKSNVSLGGDPIDVLDELPDEIKTTAVMALKAIPGLPHGAVDIIVDERQPLDYAATVLEVNPTAQIGSLLFPLKGQARDIPSAIVDYYFPETKEVDTDKAKIYFDFHSVLEPLRSKSATVTKVSPAPVGKIYAKKYIVSGIVQDINYHRGLRKQAFERGLSGFVSNLDDGKIEVVVAGTDYEKVNEYKEAIFGDPERSQVLKIEEECWNQPIKIGFEVGKVSYAVKMKNLADEMKKIKQEIKVLEKERKSAESHYNLYRRSSSWILTYPIRKVADLLKYIFRKIA